MSRIAGLRWARRVPRWTWMVLPSAWGWACGLGLLFVLLHRHFLHRMFFIATGAPSGDWYTAITNALTLNVGGDWSHALVVPFISGYFIYQQRDRLANTPARVYWPGLAVLYLGLISYVFWIYPGCNDMFQGYSMMLSLFGLVLFLFGPAVMKVLWFPIFYLALGVKISDMLWDHIAWQLQTLAAHWAAAVLSMIGVLLDLEASVRGATIELVHRGVVLEPALNVAEACSGLRMLMAFVALGAAIAYLTPRPWWQRLTMFFMAVPIAVGINVARVTALGLLYLRDPQLAAGDFHTFVGLLMLIPAAGLFLLLGWVLDRVVVRDGGAQDEQGPVPVPEDPGGLMAALAALTVSGREAGTHWRGVAKGLLGGVLLTGGIAVELGLFVAVYRPDVLFGGYLNRDTALGLFGVGLVVLAGAGWWARRRVRPERVVGHSGPSPVVAMAVAGGILITAVLGMRGVIRASHAVLIKQAVPLRHALYELPERCGTWHLVREDLRLTESVIEALGTRQYISRVYRDQAWHGQESGALARLHVTYYTGTPDTIPHVPDRCFVAGGMIPVGSPAVTTVRLSGPQYRQGPGGWTSANSIQPTRVQLPGLEMPATIFTFAQPHQPDRQSNVIYFFVANGRFLPTPEQVRLRGFDLRDRYSYYCKVEVGIFGVPEREDATDRVSAFLSVVMPEIMACLPQVSGPVD